MYRSVVGSMVSGVLLISAGSAAAYQVNSAFSNPCHETISVVAYDGVLDDFDTSRVPLPKSSTWRKIAQAIERSIGVDYQTPQEELILVSLVVGTRAPDTDGHSVANFTQLRNIHLDPDGQYHHSLRAPEDDHSEGDTAAIEGMRDWVQEQVNGIRASVARPPPEQIIRVTIFLDFYGRFEIEVWEPAFRLGVAAHALQDTFTHMIRSANTRRVHHVLNYSDAVAGEHSEERDGMAHSDSLDDCSQDGPVRALAESAAQATGELFLAIREEISEGNDGAVAAMLEEWTVHEPDCTLANDYCDSPWVEYAREKLSGPYLCSYTGAPIDEPWRQVGLPWALLLAGLAVRRRRRR